MILYTNNLKTAMALSGIAFVFFSALYLIVGHQQSFLLLNHPLGAFADYFFLGLTYLGDGLVWLLVLAYIFLTRKKNYLPLLLFLFGYSTIITQVLKYLILPDEPRPLKAIANTQLIHQVQGVDVHLISSFPSGHTTTAFVVLFALALMQPTKKWIGLLFITAILVGYSRIYLAQHFPRDIAGGILAATLTVYATLFTLKWTQKNKISYQ